jgi:DNA-binding NarL/FixJ family response regulator
MTTLRHTLLLVEQQSLVRSTVAAVARQMDLACIEETSSIDAAEQRLSRARYDGLLLSLDEQVPALALLARLRAGESNSDPDIPVILMAHACDAELAVQVRQHGVRRLLLKPFKLKLLLQTIETLSQQIRDGQPA